MRKIYCDICGDEQLYENWVEPLKIKFAANVIEVAITDYDEVCRHCRQAVQDSILKTISEIKK